MVAFERQHDKSELKDMVISPNLRENKTI